MKVPDPGRDDYEYYVSVTIPKNSAVSSDIQKIKWQGKAHYHSTWETNTALTSCRGIRRLENYFRKTVQEEIHIQQDEDISREEEERWQLDRERVTDALTDYTKVERVIDMKEDEVGDTLYLVKCKLFSHENVSTGLTQDREGTLLRLLHLGDWQPGEQYCAD